MSDPPDRPGMFLPGMSWFSEVEAEGRLISRKWKAWRQASKVKNRKAPYPLGSILKRNEVFPETFLLSGRNYPVLTHPFRFVQGLVSTPDQIVGSIVRVEFGEAATRR